MNNNRRGFMFQSARLKMPALDYVSIVQSLYRDRVAMMLGTIATAVAAAAAGVQADAPLLFVFAALFLVVALVRYREALAFDEAEIGPKDAVKAEYWEFRATLSGSLAAILYGSWCFFSLVFIGDGFATLTSVSVSIAALVGIYARNFGLDRLVTLQSVLLGAPLTLGLILVGDVYHVLLAMLFAPMLISFRAVAADVRNVLLSAVHDRVEVSRLAAELDTAMSTMSHGLCMLDADLRIAVANNRMQEMLCGAIDPDHECIGKDFAEMIAYAKSKGSLTDLSAQRLTTAVANGRNTKLILQLFDGRQYEVSINARNSQIVLVLEDITERVLSENRIKFMARFDPLTNLPNRAYFSEQVHERLMQTKKSGPDANIALMIVDIDDFKHINDSLGHPTGDKLLCVVARRIRQTLDSNVLVGRFGGDEFTIYFDEQVNRRTIKNAAENLLLALRAPMPIDDRMIEVRSSIGYVLGIAGRCSLEKLFKRADLALYSAKGDGKGTCATFQTQMDKDYNERQLLKVAMRQALRNGELSLAYQPVVCIKTHKVLGCEALTRWHHPEFGTIAPSVFIPIAEEIGVISELTDWVLHTATSECAGWPGDIGVAVNISARDFRGDNVQKMVLSALAKSGLAPNRLEIEVTETVLVEELDVASRVLSEISAHGVGIALDDFGTGYSSLAYLHELPFSKLKIDRTFAVNVTSDPRSLKLMNNIARLSKDLDMVVTVEGVETEEQLAAISEIGLIDQVQGFLFGAPVPQNEIARLVTLLSGLPLREYSRPGKSGQISFASRAASRST